MSDGVSGSGGNAVKATRNHVPAPTSRVASRIKRFFKLVKDTVFRKIGLMHAECLVIAQSNS
jgi:hypothetical protein